jgi:hypothetical protein
MVWRRGLPAITMCTARTGPCRHGRHGFHRDPQGGMHAVGADQHARTDGGTGGGGRASFLQLLRLRLCRREADERRCRGVARERRLPGHAERRLWLGEAFDGGREKAPAISLAAESGHLSQGHRCQARFGATAGRPATLCMSMTASRVPSSWQRDVVRIFAHGRERKQSGGHPSRPQCSTLYGSRARNGWRLTEHGQHRRRFQPRRWSLSLTTGCPSSRTLLSWPPAPPCRSILDNRDWFLVSSLCHLEIRRLLDRANRHAASPAPRPTMARSTGEPYLD